MEAAGPQAPQSTAGKIRTALEVNADKAKDAADGGHPEQAEMYAAATLRLAQALSTLEANHLT